MLFNADFVQVQINFRAIYHLSVRGYHACVFARLEWNKMFVSRMVIFIDNENHAKEIYCEVDCYSMWLYLL